MNPIIVQLNHPGNEKPFRNGYFPLNNQIVREWNKGVHCRKFINNAGEFIPNLKSKPQKGNLLFWGEWEGYSFFNPINNGDGIPNGIHEPFHSTVNRGSQNQNTDPYIFGDFFKYAICSQTGVMRNLSNGSLILFGTTTNDGFLLDTVFIVKTHETAVSVCGNNAINYTNVYREETLEQLGSIYLGHNPSATNKIYSGQTWWDCNEYFSFVPCQISTSNCYNKAILDFTLMSKQKVGHPYKHFANKNPIDIWKYVVNSVLEQGFLLGVKFDEPNTNTILTNNKEISSTTDGLAQAGCGFSGKHCG
jgi:hypothetical protein